MSVSLRDFQKCFEKERQVLLQDMESLRQQLIKKENTFKRVEKNASLNSIQLKKEIQALQNALTHAQKEAQKYQEKFTHTSSLLENAMDQRQEDQVKIADLTEKLRTFDKRQEETIGVIKREASANIDISNEERKSLRTRVDHLRSKLETERKEWITSKRILEVDLDKTKIRLQMAEKELKESRFREQSTHQMKDKMTSEVALYKRKLTEASHALQQAIESKTSLKADCQLALKKLKDKMKEVEQDYQKTKGQMVMLQEDYAALFRTRQQASAKNKALQERKDLLLQKHEQEKAKKEEIIKTLECKQARLTFVCKNCKTDPEERQAQIREEVNQEKDLLKEELSKEFQLERWEKFNAFQLQFIQLTDELQRVGKEKDLLLAQNTSLHSQVETFSTQLTLLEQQKHLFASKNQELQSQLDEQDAFLKTNEVKINELMENIKNLSQVSAEQSKQIQELEQIRCLEKERHLRVLDTVEMEKKHFFHENQQLQKQLTEQRDHFEQIKKDTTKQWNEMVQAQLSANLLIEEQAHTIDDLLKVNKHSSTCTGPSDSTQFSSSSQEKKANDVYQYQQKIMELVNTLEQMTKEKEKLEKKIEEQALTIHELTLQEDSATDEDEDDQEEVDLSLRLEQERKTWTSPSKHSAGTGISVNIFQLDTSDDRHNSRDEKDDDEEVLTR